MKQKLKYDKFGVPMTKRLNFCARISGKGVNVNYIRRKCGARDRCISCSMYTHRGRCLYRLYFQLVMNRVRSLMDTFASRTVVLSADTQELLWRGFYNQV